MARFVFVAAFVLVLYSVHGKPAAPGNTQEQNEDEVMLRGKLQDATEQHTGLAMIGIFRGCRLLRQHICAGPTPALPTGSTTGMTDFQWILDLVTEALDQDTKEAMILTIRSSPRLRYLVCHAPAANEQEAEDEVMLRGKLQDATEQHTGLAMVGILRGCPQLRAHVCSGPSPSPPSTTGPQTTTGQLDYQWLLDLIKEAIAQDTRVAMIAKVRSSPRLRYLVCHATPPTPATTPRRSTRPTTEGGFVDVNYRDDFLSFLNRKRRSLENGLHRLVKKTKESLKSLGKRKAFLRKLVKPQEDQTEMDDLEMRPPVNVKRGNEAEPEEGEFTRTTYIAAPVVTPLADDHSRPAVTSIVKVDGQFDETLIVNPEYPDNERPWAAWGPEEPGFPEKNRRRRSVESAPMRNGDSSLNDATARRTTVPRFTGFPGDESAADTKSKSGPRAQYDAAIQRDASKKPPVPLLENPGSPVAYDTTDENKDVDIIPGTPGQHETTEANDMNPGSPQAAAQETTEGKLSDATGKRKDVELAVKYEQDEEPARSVEEPAKKSEVPARSDEDTPKMSRESVVKKEIDPLTKVILDLDEMLSKK